MDVILVPGFWLDGSSWEGIVPYIDEYGHRAHPLTLPGMESRDADRSSITLRDHVDAVVAAIDSLDPAEKVVLVGHSGGGDIVHGAVDARPERVARVVYVDCFPGGEGSIINDQLPVENGEIPLPDWSAFDDEDLVNLTDDLRASFRARAIPTPAHVARDPQHLSDERRYDVPATVIACEFSSAQLREWIEGGQLWVQELAKIREVEYVDLPTGHWPQFTRPEDLAWKILGALPLPAVDNHGRPQPPLTGDEAETLLGFLEYQRATFAWKCRGLDAAGMNMTVGASSMTLGGMMKHLALVENYWFSQWLHGREAGLPWNAGDWDADPDWDWHSAAEDSPEELFALWQDAVSHARSEVEEALSHGGLDQMPKKTWPDGRAPNLRWIITHMIEEYARHNGHADLIREAVDGETGE